MIHFCRRLLALSGLSLLLGACASSPAGTLRQSLQSLRSWTATARLAGEAWADRAVPDAYARQTFGQALRQLEDETQNVAKLPPSELTRGTLARARSAARDVGRLAEALRAQDRGSAREVLAQLAAQDAALRSLAAKVGR